jgi:predicted DNA binding protein
LIQLQFSASPENWIGKLCSDKSALIRVMSVRAQDHANEITHFVDISSDGSSAEVLSGELKSMSDVTECDLARVAANRIIGSVTSNDCVVCKALVESKTNTFIAPAKTEENCHLNYKVYISSEGLTLFLQRLHREGVDYKLGDLSPLKSKKVITARQQKVLKSALELGYYDYPKRISTEELATTMGVRSGTISEILRRAEKNVIKKYLDAD